MRVHTTCNLLCWLECLEQHAFYIYAYSSLEPRPSTTRIANPYIYATYSCWKSPLPPHPFEHSAFSSLVVRLTGYT